MKIIQFVNCSSIFQCIKPIFYVSKVFGLAPYSLPTKGGVLKKATISDYIIAVLSGSLNIYFFYSNINVNYLLPPSKSLIFDFCSRSSLSLIILFLLVTLFLNMINRSKIWNIFQLIHECDEKV